MNTGASIHFISPQNNMHMPGTLFKCVNCRSDRRREAMFLVRISNELQIATFNHQLSDLIRQYSAINLMGDLMDD